MTNIPENFTFIHDDLTGFGQAFKNIKYTHMWDDALFKNSGEIYFYKSSTGNISFDNIVDISAGKKPEQIVIHTYPHNPKTLFNSLIGNPSNRASLVFLFETLRTKYGDKKMVFTVDTSVYDEVDADHFTRFANDNRGPIKQTYEAFMIESKVDGVGFPRINVIEIKDLNDFRSIFPVQVWSSHWLTKPSGPITAMGKYLSYILINSALSSKFSDHAPSLSSVSLPTRETPALSGIYKTDLLVSFIKAVGADKVVNKGGKMVYMGDDEEPIQPFITDDDKGLEDRIIKDIVDRGSANFSDISLLGIGKFMRLVPEIIKPIPVLMDIPGLAKRMCMLSGFLYAVPSSKEGEEQLKDELEEYVIICDETAFPELI
jgi:hypothetical protein